MTREELKTFFKNLKNESEIIVWIGGLYDDMSKEDRDWRLYVKFNSPDDFYIEGETL